MISIKQENQVARVFQYGAWTARASKFLGTQKHNLPRKKEAGGYIYRYMDRRDFAIIADDLDAC